MITDNDSLKWLFKGSKRNNRLARWVVRLQGYEFDIKHRGGLVHSNVDYPSRAPLSDGTFPPVDPLDRAPAPVAPNSRLEDPSVIIDADMVQTRSSSNRTKSLSMTDRQKTSVTKHSYMTDTDLHSSSYRQRELRSPEYSYIDILKSHSHLSELTKQHKWSSREILMRYHQEQNVATANIIKVYEQQEQAASAHIVNLLRVCVLERGLVMRQHRMNI